MEQQVEFPVGDLMLEGLLSLPASTPGMGIVVCHPHPLRGGDMHNNVVTALVRECQAEGMATLRFNFRGVGRSGGRHDDGNAEQDDVKAAVAYLVGRSALPSVAVAGYSFGSIVGLKAGAQDARVDKLIGVALPIASRDASFLRRVTKPKLLVSGSRDDYAPLPRLEELFAAIPEPKWMSIVTGADHFFGGLEGDAARAACEFLAGR